MKRQTERPNAARHYPRDIAHETSPAIHRQCQKYFWYYCTTRQACRLYLFHASMSKHPKKHPTRAANPCTDVLTDIEYLEHMIPHHQVAIDMSHQLLATRVTSPTILHLCRNIIRKQQYEIWEMTGMKRRLPSTVFRPPVRARAQALGDRSRAGCGESGSVTLTYSLPCPTRVTGACDPLFFDPDAHHKHMQHASLTVEKFLDHMIPHHQVAVNMSRRLLLHTNNSYLMDFCRRLIVDQQYEIRMMRDLLQNTATFASSLL